MLKLSKKHLLCPSNPASGEDLQFVQLAAASVSEGRRLINEWRKDLDPEVELHMWRNLHMREDIEMARSLGITVEALHMLREMDE